MAGGICIAVFAFLFCILGTGAYERALVVFIS